MDRGQPYYRTDAPETGGGPTRSVLVFRLRSLDVSPPSVTTDAGLAMDSEVAEVKIEEQFSGRYSVNPTLAPTNAERKEALLVKAFAQYLEGLGIKVTRNKIRPRGEAKPIYSDVYIGDLNMLIEAKGSIERGSFRTAIGQLADYRRFLNKPICAILVPMRPNDDLLELMRGEGIDVLWPEGVGYAGLNLSSRHSKQRGEAPASLAATDDNA